MHLTAAVGAEGGERAQRVGELDLAATPGLGLLQHIEDGRVQDVAADHREVRRGVSDVRLLHQVGDVEDVLAEAVGLHRRAAVEVDLRGVDLHQGHHRAAQLLLDLDHAGQQRVARVDQVVAQQDGERLAGHVLLGDQDRVAQALRVALADVVHVGQRDRLADPAELVLVALAGEQFLQLVGAVEVVLQGALVAAGDHQYVGEAGRRGLFHHVLDRGLVDDREHLLGRGLGGRQEAGPQAGRRHYGLGDRHSSVRRGHAFDLTKADDRGD